MILELIPKDYPSRDLNQLYQLRPKFWMVSVIAHVLWFAVAVRIPLSTPGSKRPIYDQFIRPLESKVLVYRPKKRVEAKAETRVGKSPDTRAKIASPRTIIADAPQAKSQKQIIWKPVNLPEVKVDVPVPAVVARVETALPPPPPRPKAPSKQFVPPEAKPDRQLPRQAEIAASLPEVRTSASAPLIASRTVATLPPPPKITPKQFAMPPSKQEPRLPQNTAISDSLKLPEIKTEAPSAVARIGAALPPPPKTAPKQFNAPAAPQRSSKAPGGIEIRADLAPATADSGANASTPAVAFSRLPAAPRDLPPAPPTTGNGRVNIAVASINPVPNAELPSSSRPGQFSVAPVVGEPSSGAPSPSAITVPNLTVREPAAPKPAPVKSNTVVYAEKVPANSTATFAVPLRPANRAIPRAIDARFPGRNVYAVVVPIENLPAYGGDWILWFAEIAPLAGQTPAMRSPVPYRKIELVEKGRETKDTRIQIAGILGKDGKLHDAKVISSTPAEAQVLALEDLAAWEFKPATRNGIASDIDVVFEVPLRLPIRP